MTLAGSPVDDHQHDALDAALRDAELSLEELWIRYFALGGDVDLFEVEGYLAGLVPLEAAQRDLLAHAVNERLDELFTARRVPYSRTIRPRRPADGPLAALVHLLEGAHRLVPERLGTLAEEAGRAMGVQLAVHLVDHEQRLLRRFGLDIPAGEAFGVDGTLPGRAFRTGRTLPSVADGRARLWVPLIDGADRLGVLEVGTATAADLYDPALREQCRWLSHLLGHLVAGMTQYGDEIEFRRRSRPRTPSAELIWQQLPPLTASTRSFVLAGIVEPGYTVGGDAFDYALSRRNVSLAVFDAMGHGLDAGLLAAAALAAYRSARRAGGGTSEQARVIDRVIADQFSDSRFVTGVLADLDVAAGRLRYIGAGHPPPLLLRDGHVVKQLTGGRRPPFGLGDGELTVAEEMLEPGDWLVLYTDGITEARDAAGNWFGEERLVEFLTREAAAGHPPPETVRRVVGSVLEHQGGLLQDDASILLACWASSRAGPRCLPPE